MKKIEKLALEKQEARKIVKNIIDFGITENQKIDIMYFLALTLENHENLVKLTDFLKKFKSIINKEKEVDNVNNKNKLLL
tara:strand:- start:1440 stop:1679 length:240 start_codon:yes stop_codon:yes gene_type:complete